LLSYGHLKFFTLGPDIGHRILETRVILYSVQCCYAVHWTDNNNWLLSSLVLLFGVTAPLFLVCGTPELSEEAYEFVVRRW